LIKARLAPAASDHSRPSDLYCTPFSPGALPPPFNLRQQFHPNKPSSNPHPYSIPTDLPLQNHTLPCPPYHNCSYPSYLPYCLPSHIHRMHINITPPTMQMTTVTPTTTILSTVMSTSQPRMLDTGATSSQTTNTILSTVSPPSSNSSPTPGSVETLSSLCGWWADTKQDPLPSICHQFVSPHLLDRVETVMSPQIYSHTHTQPLYRHHASSTDSLSSPFGTGRSISIIGILGGVLFILLIVALITCLRRRKRCSSSVDSHTEDLHHVHTLHQVRVSQHLLGLASREAPPDYSTVVKQKEEEEEAGLPSYSQAVGHEEVISDSSSK